MPAGASFSPAEHVEAALFVSPSGNLSSYDAFSGKIDCPALLNPLSRPLAQ